MTYVRDSNSSFRGSYTSINENWTNVVLFTHTRGRRRKNQDASAHMYIIIHFASGFPLGTRKYSTW